MAQNTPQHDAAIIPDEGIARPPKLYYDPIYPKFFTYHSKQEKVSIKFHGFIEYLRALGFQRLDIGSDFIFIRIQDSIAEECSITYIQDVFFKTLDKLPTSLYCNSGQYIKKKKLVEKIYKGIQTYFAKGLLARLGNISNLEFLEDGKDYAYFYFKNCVVKIHKEGLDVLDYTELRDKIIWRNSILEYNFSKLKADKVNDSVIAKFITNLSMNKNIAKENIVDINRSQALKTIIGYNLHSYFETKLKATILTDTGINDEAEGRTGKTLLVKLLGKMMNAKRESTTFVEIAGKNFDFSKAFRYAQCRLDTKLVHINDTKDKFQFELLYNDITEGITSESKNKNPFVVYAKIILSSNRTIRLNGASDRDRAIEFQVSDHYSPEYSPADEFGHWFFRDWDDNQWNEFFNYMIDCVRLFLICGLQQPENIDLQERKLVEETSREFVDYMDTFIQGVQNDKKYNKKDMFEEFTKNYEDFGIWLRQNTFTKWLVKWAKTDNRVKKIEEGKSGSLYYIIFSLEK